MSAILSEILLSEFMISSTLQRRTHLVQSFSVVFLYWFYIFSFLSSTTKSSMASSPSGTSSGSSQLQNSGSEDLQAVMDQKKLRRMISNRESARRSRMRKQKHLDELMAQLNQLRKENRQLSTAFSLTKQQYVAVDAENCVLRAQMMELGNRLQSLDEILSFLNMNINISGHQMIDNSIKCLNQPIMASADILCMESGWKEYACCDEDLEVSVTSVIVRLHLGLHQPGRPLQATKAERVKETLRLPV
ncbi:hypothetical protein C4D60_Mb01t16030 [Musa balbisiana]|uniref:BZIP domain-containing protein n=1 Tax=Musa balbisiana TaxID=52838 RepID=A0A4S8JNI8_MUSBA|nr:hypothetical protein C4D60_Mb01t16030 [Musa balbisiana]